MTRKLNVSSAVLIAAMGAGCGGGLAQGGAAQNAAATYKVPEESKVLVRQQEKASLEGLERAENEQLDKMEQEARRALSAALGKEAFYPGSPVPYPSSEAVAELRKANIALRVQPVVNQEGVMVGQNFLELKDSFTDNAQVIGRKIAEQKASKAEIAEMQRGAKYAVKLGDLRMQVMQVSIQTTTSVVHLATSAALSPISLVGMMVSVRKQQEMSWTDEDYAYVQHALERQRRAEAISATTMGMLAAYQIVLNDQGDPKALDAIAEAGLKAFPMKPTVTLEEAKSYVAKLGQNVGLIKPRYEKWMRELHGNAKYERDFKASIDAMFRQIEKAEQQKTPAELAALSMQQFRTDREKCARGEQLPPGSMAGGPGCEEARRAFLKGDQALLAQLLNMPGAPAVPGQIATARNGLNALAEGNVSGALDSAVSLFPGDGTVKSAMKGLSALAKGDAKGAFRAVLDIVPYGGLIKDALGFAARLFGIK